MIHQPDQIEWIEFRDQPILSIEFDHASEEKSLLLMREFVDEISRQADGSVLFMAGLAHAGFQPNLVLKWQNLQNLIHSKCARVAVVGAHGVIAIAAQTFINIARSAGLEIGHKVRFFENPELAKQWLVDGEAYAQAAWR